MDQQEGNTPKLPSPEAQTSPTAQQAAEALKEKITEIIDKGLAGQDKRTANLLVHEISGSPKPVNEAVEREEATEDTAQSLNKNQEELPKWLQRFNAWHRKVMSDFVFLLWLAVIVGLFAGFAAHIFNRLITITSGFFLSHIEWGRINWWLIFLPVAGIVLAGIYTRYVVRTDLTHGVSRMMHSLYKGEFIFRRNLIYSPILGSTITLGLGGSAGSEGPIAISGAAIGSNLGRWLDLKMPLVKVLVGCGAAAGISGIFQSPVGGLLFTLEFLKMEIGTLSILAVMLACLVSYGMVFLCNGCHIPSEFRPEDSILPEQYWAVLLMGVLCGAYSMYYSRVINYTDTIFINIKNPWIRNLTGGFGVGLCLLLFPALYGVGYPVMSDLIHTQFDALTKGDIMPGLHIGSWGVMLVAFLILGIKCWACGACNASGGVSSDFAPTLYAGAVFGFLFSYFCNTILHTNLPIPAFVLLGMAAVMAGCIEAPMMSIFIVINMGTDFQFMLAMILGVYSSYIIVRVLSHIRGYDSKLAKHLEWFHTHENENVNSGDASDTEKTTAPFQT